MQQTNQNLIYNLDDDQEFNLILKRILEKNGFKLKSTRKSDEFAELLKQERPALCLIDLNLDIALGAGFYFLQAIRKKFQDLPVFICSRRAKKADIIRALELGANDYIQKPIDDTLLLHKINHICKINQMPPLPLFKVSEKNQPCDILFEINVDKVSEFGITLSSDHFISKGTHLELSGNLMEEIIGSSKPFICRATTTTINDETKKYNTFIEFNPNDTELLQEVRKFIHYKHSISESSNN